MKKYHFLILASILAVSCKKQVNLTESTSKNFKANTKSSTAILAQATSFDVNEIVSVEQERIRTRNVIYLTDFTATGLYMPPGTVNLTVTQLSGSRLPKLIIGTYGRGNPSVVQLTAGANAITNNTGGLLWIRYTDAAPNSTARVKFDSGYKLAPYYESASVSQAQYLQQLQTYTDVPEALIKSQNGKVIIVASRTSALQYANENIHDLIIAARAVIDAEDAMNGLDGSAPQHVKTVHNYLMSEKTSTGNPYANSYHIGVPASWILTVDGFKQWGTWHELGHQHQMIWRWNPMLEVTVNIYSLAAQRYFFPGQPSRLTVDGKWDKAMTYLAYPNSTKDYNGSTAYTNPLTDVFVKVCMFEQLRLEYGDNFFKNLAKTERVTQPQFNQQDDPKIKWFMVTASQLANKDLTAFFQKWGLRCSTTALTNDAYAAIAALGLPAPTSDPSLRRE